MAMVNNLKVDLMAPEAHQSHLMTYPSKLFVIPNGSTTVVTLNETTATSVCERPIVIRPWAFDPVPRGTDQRR